MSNLVNTSLPAKMAPKLAPATLASLTTNHEAAAPKPYSLSERLSALKTGKESSGFSPYQKHYQAPSSVALTSVKKPANTEEEFPSLGAAKPKTVVASDKPSFSELSRNWGKKQKEEEEKAKEDAKKEMELQRQQKQEKCQTIRIIPFRTVKKKEKKDDLPLSDLSDDPPIEYEEEEEEEECEDGWNGRKHRDELY